MIVFLDGPAIGNSLELQRVPRYLRVTITAAGDVDALDQLDDVPRDDETLHAYVLSGTPTRVHVCRQPRSQSGWRNVAAYVLVKDQPADAVMRDTLAWQDWTHGQYERALEAQLRKIGATDGEVRFLLSCDLPADADEINEWCDTNLDDLRRSQ